MSYFAYNLNPSVHFSGLAALGLGALLSYEEQLAIYKVDLAKWTKDKATYDKALASYNSAIQSIDTTYAKAYYDYQLKLAEWTKKYSIYQQQLAGYQQTVSAMKAEYQRLSQAVATKYGLTLPSGFTCVSKAAHDYYMTFDCTVVKGIGAYNTYGSGCGAQQLPVCAYPTAPKSPGAAPTAPKKAAYPKPPAALRPKPVAPTPPPPSVTTTSTTTTDTPVLTPPAESPNKASMVKVGLIAVVAVVGGVALYKTFT